MKAEPESVSEQASDYTPPIQRPILVYDGNCPFCRYWVNRWRRRTAGEVYYIPFQQVPGTFYGISKEEFQKSVYLITQYRRLHGAEAIFELLAIGGDPALIRLYNNIPLADTLFESCYRVVADHRSFFYKLLKLFVRNA